MMAVIGSGIFTVLTRAGTFLLLIACSMQGTHATNYSITDLGANPGPYGPTFCYVNDAGQVALSTATSTGAIHAALWLPAPAYGLPAGLHDLGSLDSESMAYNINNLGQVVGRYGGSRYWCCGDSRAFLWLPSPAYGLAAGMHDLGPLPGFSQSGAYSINDAGQITGYSANYSGDPNSTATLWSDGAVYNIQPPDSSGTSATDINNSGQVIVNSVSDGFVWTPFETHGTAGTWQNIGSLGSGSGGGHAINDAGYVAGYAPPVGSTTIHAALYDGVTMQDIGTLGGDLSNAWDINASNVVVGEASTGTGAVHGFVYRNGVMADLNDLIPPGSGWVLTRGTNINASGQIAGFGLLNGQYHSYVLTPIPSYSVTALYDQTKAHKSGSTIPVKIQILDESGANISSAGFVVHALRVVRISDEVLGTLEDSGSSNPDLDFRYDAELAGYIFNLSLKGYAIGTYRLEFKAGSDPETHSVQFGVK